ncbi:unnamed protein product, partial [Brenthis ino]
MRANALRHTCTIVPRRFRAEYFVDQLRKPKNLSWILCLVAFTLTATKCEPPVNSYLPPSSGSGGRPSSQYGVPGGNQGPFGRPNASGQNLGNQPGTDYNPSGISSSPPAEYGTPDQFSPGSQRGGSRGSQGRGQGSVPSSQYGSPNQQGTNGGAGSYRGRGSSQRPDSAYGTPNGLQALGGFNAGPQGQGSRQPFGGSPSSSYGTPDFGNDVNSMNQNYRGSGVDDSHEPAKYEFSYEVDNPETGTKFGHSEQRDGDVTTGEYNVLLPDGRKQVVEYEADRRGFKPQIRYEGTDGGSGSGFGRGGQGRNQGYPRASASANAFAGSDAGYPGSGSRGSGPQGGRYQQPGSGSSDYPSGGPDQQGFGIQGPGYPRSGGPAGYPGDVSGGYPGSQGNRGQNGRGGISGEGYPSGGPNGPRGSGY